MKQNGVNVKKLKDNIRLHTSKCGTTPFSNFSQWNCKWPWPFAFRMSKRSNVNMTIENQYMIPIWWQLWNFPYQLPFMTYFLSIYAYVPIYYLTYYHFYCTHSLSPVRLLLSTTDSKNIKFRKVWFWKLKNRAFEDLLRFDYLSTWSRPNLVNLSTLRSMCACFSKFMVLSLTIFKLYQKLYNSKFDF